MRMADRDHSASKSMLVLSLKVQAMSSVDLKLSVLSYDDVPPNQHDVLEMRMGMNQRTQLLSADEASEEYLERTLCCFPIFW